MFRIELWLHLKFKILTLTTKETLAIQIAFISRTNLFKLILIDVVGNGILYENILQSFMIAGKNPNFQLNFFGTSELSIRDLKCNNEVLKTTFRVSDLLVTQWQHKSCASSFIHE